MFIINMVFLFLIIEYAGKILQKKTGIKCNKNTRVQEEMYKYIYDKKFNLIIQLIS